MDAGKPAEQFGQALYLSGLQVRADQLLADCRMRRSCLPQLRPAGRRQHRIGDTAVLATASSRGQTRRLEPVQQPRDAGGCEAETLGEIDPPHRAVLGAGEVEERLEVVRAQPLLGDEARLDFAHQ